MMKERKKLTFLSSRQSVGCLQQIALPGWLSRCITLSGHAAHLSCDAIGQRTHRQCSLCLQMQHVCLFKGCKYIRSSAGSSNYSRYNKQSIEILKEKERFTEIDNRLIKSGKKGVKFAVNKKFIGTQKMTLNISEIRVIEQI